MGKSEFDSTIPESFLDAFVRRPGAFVVPTTEARTAAMTVVGRTYDAANVADKFGLYDDWKSVAESGFDPSLQLWELISFRNEPVLKHTADTMKELSLLLDSAAISGSDSESESGSSDGEDQSMSASDLEDSDAADLQSSDEETAAVVEDDEESDEAQSASGEESEQEGEEEESESEPEGGDAEPSVVDDEFFSLAEMEKFADDAEEEDMRDRAILAGDYPKRTAEEEENDEESDESEDDENDIDLFQDFSDADMDEDDAEDDNPDSMMYSDFFKAPKGSKRAAAKASREKHAKRVKFDPSAEMSDQDKSGDDGDDNEDDAETAGRTTNLFDDMSDDGGDSGEGGEAKSEFEKRQEKLQGLIAKLEDEAVEKKHWTMTGEVESSARPKNSLLQEDVDFDHVQKAVPVITQEATQSLEDIIKRRILNEEWDDVERKKDIQQKPFRPSEQFELNDKAPQKSLAEEYEDAFMAQKAGDAYVPESDAKVTAAHKEIDDLFRNLFVQLDAMSHFHFAPKPLSTEIEIRSSAPALDMEEKLPVNVSTAQQLAPEEVYEKDKGRNGRTGDLVGNSEMTREERKRRRNHKKHFDKAKAKKAAAEAKPKAAAAVAEPSNIKTAEA